MEVSNTKIQRRSTIASILGQQTVHNQAQLADLLQQRGQAANQATLSRDLRDMGIVKGADGYQLPSPLAAGPGDAHTQLLQAGRQYLREVIQIEHQVLLKTPSGAAQPLAVAIDAAQPADVLGTLAGDDTLLVLTADPEAAGRIAAWLGELT